MQVKKEKKKYFIFRFDWNYLEKKMDWKNVSFLGLIEII